MISLRLGMRDSYRRRIAHVSIANLNDPNAERVDLNKGEKEFNKMMKVITTKLTV